MRRRALAAANTLEPSATSNYTEKLDGCDHPRGSLSDPTFLAEASHQPGDLRAQDAHYRAEQGRAARHRCLPARDCLHADMTM